MPEYKYTGPDERIPVPPVQGDLIPGETVRSEEPVDHPDLEEVKPAKLKATPKE